ncbi:hypothetical protein [Pectobacterium brasiliense]|uniref:hypothetical protein n=1 Tax=Pectobacterium brasiliense TaxID=180957 RepID=UPI0004E6D103|nr:hypothetical protein [Pectobacterium brasiliense]KFF67226.1 hypothetical protein IW00_09630 [Pectobacterium brasiliense]
MKHNPEIWLQAADDAVESFLSQHAAVREFGNGRGYCCVSVLSSLESLADAVHYLNYPLSKFIKAHANHWRRYGMGTHHPEFLKAWQRHNARDDSMKIVI